MIPSNSKFLSISDSFFFSSLVFNLDYLVVNFDGCSVPESLEQVLGVVVSDGLLSGLVSIDGVSESGNGVVGVVDSLLVLL